jgi:hypothetical protein
MFVNYESEIVAKDLPWSITGLAMIANYLLQRIRIISKQIHTRNDIGELNLPFVLSNEFLLDLCIPYVLILLRNKRLANFEGLQIANVLGYIFSKFWCFFYDFIVLLY